MPNNKETNKITLGVTDLSFHRVTGAVVAYVLEKMGFSVRCEYALHEDNFNKLSAGSIDMIASAWLPFSHGVYKEKVEQTTSLTELGLHYEPYALWGVPDYVPDTDVLEISDLLNPKVKAKMLNRIQGIGQGAGITRFSIKMMQEYKLSDAGYEFFTGTQDDCINAFEKAVENKQWVVVPLWHPQFLHSKYTIRDLKDPKALLGGKDRAVLLARDDVLKNSFNQQQIEVLNKIKLSNSIVADLDYSYNREGNTEAQAVEKWIAKNPEVINKWL